MARRIKTQDDYYLASQWQLMLRKLKKHRLAQISFIVLAILYIGAVFGDFIGFSASSERKAERCREQRRDYRAETPYTSLFIGHYHHFRK